MIQNKRISIPWLSFLLIIILIAQTALHLVWFDNSAHSGQLAIPWMMNHGMTLFGNILEQHAPGTSFVASIVYRLSPLDPVTNLKLMNTLVILALSLLVYYIAYRLRGPWSAIIAVTIWVWWEPVYDLALFYFDTVLSLFLMLAIALWLGTEERRPAWLAPLLAGLMLGGATLFKQHAWLAVILFGLWLLLFRPRGKDWLRDLVVYGSSALVLPLALVGYYAAQGLLDSYLYWNWTVNLSAYQPDQSLTGDNLRRFLFTDFLAPAFLILAWFKTEKVRSHWFLVGIMWLAALVLLYPVPYDIHVMGHLPQLTVMSGIVLAEISVKWWEAFSNTNWRKKNSVDLVLAGSAIIVAIAWGWSGLTAYVTGPLGRGAVIAYDEFEPLAELIRSLAEPGDTLFVLPEMDSTPQIHVLAEMLPSSTWIKGWEWYLQTPGITDMLLTEWSVNPPNFIIYFPELIAAWNGNGMLPLVNFMETHYEPVADAIEITLHGDVFIYRYMEK